MRIKLFTRALPINDFRTREEDTHWAGIPARGRQPEVCLALKLMSNQSWVSVRSGKKPKKGRPMKFYSLMAPVDEIISYYEDKIYKKSQETTLAIKKVKAMSKNMPLTIPN